MPVSQDTEFMALKRYRDWGIWQVVLPLVVIVLIGIASHFVAHVQYAAIRVLGGFDLFLFCGMLLLGVGVYLSEVQLEHASARNDTDLDRRLELAKMCGIVMLLFFAVLRPDVLNGGLFVADKVVSRRGWLYVAANLATLLACVAFARYAFLRSVEIQTGTK